MQHNKGLNSAKMKDAMKYFPKAIKRRLNPPLLLPPNEDKEVSYEEVSDDLKAKKLK